MLATLALLAALAQSPQPGPDELELSEPPVFAADVDEEAPTVEGDDLEARPAPLASVEAFEAPLASSGAWTEVRGVRAWQPSPSVVGADFVPYGSGGQWVSTRAGWVFESRYPFGWATFHYGRWWYEDGLGWVWVPDTVWGPSWVDWRFGGGYTGWAPLPPLWLTSWHRPRWFFVETPHFGGRDLWRHRVGPGFASVAFSASEPVAPRRWGRTTWYAGPRWNEVARFAAQPPVRRPLVFSYPQSAPVPPGTIQFRPPPTTGRFPHPEVQPSRPFGSPPPPQPARYEAPPPQQPRYQAPPPRYEAPPPQQPRYQAPPPRYEAPPPQQPRYQAPPQQPRYQAPPPQQPRFEAPPQQPRSEAPRQEPRFEAPPSPRRSEAPTSGAPSGSVPKAGGHRHER